MCDRTMAVPEKGWRKVRTAKYRVSCESKRFSTFVEETVRATVTSRVAPGETTKRLGTILLAEVIVAILPAATAELHLNRDTSYR
jgi:hypothetical protein